MSQPTLLAKPPRTNATFTATPYAYPTDAKWMTDNRKRPKNTHHSPIFQKNYHSFSKKGFESRLQIPSKSSLFKREKLAVGPQTQARARRGGGPRQGQVSGAHVFRLRRRFRNTLDFLSPLRAWGFTLQARFNCCLPSFRTVSISSVSARSASPFPFF